MQYSIKVVGIGKHVLEILAPGRCQRGKGVNGRCRSRKARKLGEVMGKLRIELRLGVLVLHDR